MSNANIAEILARAEAAEALAGAATPCENVSGASVLIVPSGLWDMLREVVLSIPAMARDIKTLVAEVAKVAALEALLKDWNEEAWKCPVCGTWYQWSDSIALAGEIDCAPAACWSCMKTHFYHCDRCDGYHPHDTLCPRLHTEEL